ncbi:Heat shock protein DnaJ N-terminal [Penicillium manginii]|uniref:Heat shock protein DnaJ N-terminal n=1 Tax=Penicillium manginii TaxID=203109 RepID=UPI002547AB40|nr:Heat shock protein DnaJ N-terminal [Penicillium manginii]KAJ5733253.1 Heat shock protein DnaJ N-terminal [Penicillium manginii]
MTKPTPFMDYYQILNLPFGPSTSLTKQQLKLAYHKALLRHHPDKTGPTQDTTPRPYLSQGDKFTIDEITTAYKTLTDPTLRAEYDRILRLDRVKGAEREKTGDVFHTGLEVVDLEDLGCDEGGGKLFGSARVGVVMSAGFLFRRVSLRRRLSMGRLLLVVGGVVFG